MPLRLALPLLLCLLLIVHAGCARAAPRDLPPLPSLGEAQVQRLEAGGVLVLTDGGRAILAGIELPRRPLTLSAEAPWPAAEEARTALAGLIGDRPVVLYGDAGAADRYGRRQVQVVTADGRWIQAELLREGCARVAVTVDERSAAALLSAEAEARRARRGIWRQPAYRVRRSYETPGLVGSIQLVEGRVASSRLIKGDLVLHLGGNWRRSLTVLVPRPVLARFAEYPPLAAVADQPRRMAGRRLRIRGWIGKTIGPVMEVARPEQIELLDAAGRAEER